MSPCALDESISMVNVKVTSHTLVPWACSGLVEEGGHTRYYAPVFHRSTEGESEAVETYMIKLKILHVFMPLTNAFGLVIPNFVILAGFVHLLIKKGLIPLSCACKSDHNYSSRNSVIGYLDQNPHALLNTVVYTTR